MLALMRCMSRDGAIKSRKFIEILEQFFREKSNESEILLLIVLWLFSLELNSKPSMQKNRIEYFAQFFHPIKLESIYRVIS